MSTEPHTVISNQFATILARASAAYQQLEGIRRMWSGSNEYEADELQEALQTVGVIINSADAETDRIMKMIDHQRVAA
jgi:hypothetical protein